MRLTTLLAVATVVVSTPQSYWSATSRPILETTLNLGTGCTCGPPFSARAVGAVIDPVHNLVYANDATGDQNRVAVIDGETNQLIAHIPLQFGSTTGQANLIAVDPARNRVYVTDRTTPAIWTIEADSRTVLGMTPSAHNKDGESFFLANPVTGLLYLDVQPNLLVIDPNDLGNPVADLFMTGSRGHHEGTVGLGRVALDPTANLLYVATMGHQGIHVIGTNPAETATFNQVFTTLDVHDSLIAVNPLTSRLYSLTFATRSLQVIDAAPASTTFGQVLNTVSLDGPVFDAAPTVTADVDGEVITYQEFMVLSGFAINPGRDLLYARYYGEAPFNSTLSTTGALFAINASDLTVASMTVVPSIEAPFNNNPGRIAVNPTTGRIYMSEGGETAYMKILVDRPAVAFGVRTVFDQAKPHRAGSTIPIKLQLIDSAGNNVSGGSIVVQATQLALVASTAASAPDDAGGANPDSNFRFDSSLAGYIYNLRTDGLAAGTYRLSFIATGDPTVHSVQFVIGR